MSIIQRIFGKRQDDREPVRPLWHRVVEIARDRRWYADCGIADTVAGRFDAITLVLSLVLLRMEKDPVLVEPSVRLTELFVDDMDGQLRQAGVGDMIVGKRIGKLMSTLGGRLGALREALPQGEQALVPVLERNMTLAESDSLPALAKEALVLFRYLEALDSRSLLEARIDLDADDEQA